MQEEEKAEEKTKVPYHEAVERPWASNDKVLFDMLLKHFEQLSSVEVTELTNLVKQSQLQDANNKLVFDNTATHCKTLMAYSELAVKNAVEFSQKANDAYLTDRDRRETQRLEHGDESSKQTLEHENEIETTRQENMRYTLNHLYGISPEEATAMVPILKGLLKVLEGETK